MNRTWRFGSIVLEVLVDGNVRLSKSHTPSEKIIVERADVDDMILAVGAFAIAVELGEVPR